MARESRTPSHRAFCLQTYMNLHARRDSLRKELQQNALVDTAPVEFSPDSIRKSSMSSNSSKGSLDNNDPLDISQSSISSISSTSSTTSASSAPQVSGIYEVALEPDHDPRRRRFSIPFTSVDASTLVIAETQQRLRAVNQQIKLTLTAMLDDENFRKDERYRRWINSRLEETEEALMDYSWNDNPRYYVVFYSFIFRQIA